MRWLHVEKRRDRIDLQEAQLVLQECPSPIDQQLSWLYAEIAQLDELERSLALMLLDALSYKEMATVLGITESNVGVRIHRIKHLISKSKTVDRYGL
jgi:RNA polymerase sigma-70 factor (ECF subfamily)